MQSSFAEAFDDVITLQSDVIYGMCNALLRACVAVTFVFYFTSLQSSTYLPTNVETCDVA